MRRRHKLALGVTVTAAALLWGVGMAGSGSIASAATQVRVVPRAVQVVPRPPRGKPVFDATFGGTSLDTKIWDTCYPWASQRGCTNFGNRREAEWYLASQVRVSRGVLHLLARRERTVGTTATGARKVYDCRSGMITSYPGFSFEYGFVQVVAVIPHANGLWPALWLVPVKSFLPEIDMIESWGANGRPGSYFHAIGGRVFHTSYSPNITRSWQTYSLSWTRSVVRYWVGSRLVLTVKRRGPHQRMYFIANLAEYQPAKRGYCTGQLQIRSVKVWKL